MPGIHTVRIKPLLGLELNDLLVRHDGYSFGKKWNSSRARVAPIKRGPARM